MKRPVDERRFLDIAASMADSLAESVGEYTRRRRFRSLFGISTTICTKIWSLLICQVRREARPIHLLWTLFFLKHYSVEEVNATFAGVSEKTYRKWTWLMLEELSLLNLVSEKNSFYFVCVTCRGRRVKRTMTSSNNKN
jgi:hypothetical protein